MTEVMWLLALLGALGAFDTLYFHEWRGRLPDRVPMVGRELQLHVARDFIYVVIFGTLPLVAWQGGAVIVLGVLIAAEIVITLTDFVVEDQVRKPLGGLFPGERVTHALMGIVYGAALANLVPEMANWWSRPTGLVLAPPPAPQALRWALVALAAGILVSGLRDLAALLDVPPRAWPWVDSGQ
jgi:hypothetical protein